MTNYEKYRGKCKEYVDAAVEKDPTLRAVRGHYWCWSYGKQPHWWCERADGSIYDPTIDQFPQPHTNDYEEFDGMCNCSECGKAIMETDPTVSFHGNYVFCSTGCNLRFVGL